MRRAHGADTSLSSLQMFGKWFDIAIGTTCRWMKNYKEKFSMGTLVLGPGPSADQISTTSTRLRYGHCWEHCWRGLSLLQSHPTQGGSLSQGLGQTQGLPALSALRALRRGWAGLKYPMPWAAQFQGSCTMALVPQT